VSTGGAPNGSRTAALGMSLVIEGEVHRRRAVPIGRLGWSV